MPFSSTHKRIVLALFVVAFALRLFGLSHDLHLDSVYHPDTPKQMRAVQQFLRGDYLVFQGHSDYDGYPYFNSHLVEWIVRGSMAVEAGWRTWTGAWEGPVEPPSYVSLYWITRVWNAFLSALSIPLLVAIGRRFHPAAGWMAAALMVVSPLDISAAHFASNDSTVAFFCLASLWFGLRIAEAGRWRDLAGGAFCVAAAFSSKYHGGMAFLPVLIGHVLYSRTRGGIVSRPAMARWVFTGSVGLVSIFLTSPALIVHFDAQVDAVLHFFQYTANFALPAAFKELPAYQRFWIGLEENGPVLADAVGWPVLVFSLLAWLLVRRDLRVAMLVTVPLLHVVVGMSGKPFLHQAHHTPITAYVMLASVLAWLKAWSVGRCTRAARIAAVLAVGWTAGHLTVFTLRELASFHVSDTRRVAESWMLDSVPDGVQWLTGRYTIMPPRSDAPVLPVMAIAQSGDDPRILPGMVEWTRIAHAPNRFSKFINRAIHVHTVDSEHLTLPARAPYLLAFPGGRSDRILSLDTPWFGRSARVRDVRPREPVRSWAVSTNALVKAWVIVQTGDEPASLRLTFGGQAATLLLPPGSSRVIPVEAPRAHRLPFDPHVYYRWSCDVTWGWARVMVLDQPEMLAWWAMEQGDAGWLETIEPMLATDSLAGSLSRALLSPVGSAERAAVGSHLESILADTAAWLAAFGMSETWMKRVPYWEGEGVVWSPVRLPEKPSVDWLAALPLWPRGAMVLEVMPPASFAGAEVVFTDPVGRLIERGVIDHEGRVAFPRAYPGESMTVRLVNRPAPPETTRVSPDPRAMVVSWRDALASSYWEDRMPDDPPALPVAEFDHGLRVDRATVEATQVAPGASLPLDVRWWVDASVTRPDRYAVWIHVVAADGSVVAQHDRGLWYHLERAGPDRREPARRELIHLPDDMAPGRYEIRMGVWIPAQRKRLKVESSAGVPSASLRHVVMGSIDVVPAP